MHIKKQRLLTPGPTPLLPAALHAMMGSDIHHRTEDFRNLYKQVLSDLREVLGTSNDVLVLVASGSGGLEAATQNFFSPGDEVLVCSAGKFGERWVEIMKAWGMKATVLTAPYGDAVQRLRRLSRRSRKTEISKAYSCRLPKRPPARSTMSKRWAWPLKNERYFRGGRDYGHRHHAARHRRLGTGRCDRRLAKGVHDPAWTGVSRYQPEGVGARRDSAKAPRFYFDLKKEKKNAANGESAWTPNTALLLAFAEALKYIKSHRHGQS